ncbi:MAG: peptide-methionine (S)-S-oxide reductase MsrA [Anaerolineales bacterium]|nr:peptide-methionine (S)-S-oxide reductase MsrA [Anaerolineales bacterium]
MGNLVQLATLAGGCFWCLETVFSELKGVNKVVSGYSGGKTKKPTYGEVCEDTTGHAEVVQIEFDPETITFQDLLRVFFTIHDPTTLNRQGADVGTQYRSAIFYHNESQRQTAEKIIQEIAISGIWKNPIVTEVSPFSVFYKAEDYHQNYYVNNPDQGYCRAVIAPKVAKIRSLYMDKLKKIGL